MDSRLVIIVLLAVAVVAVLAVGGRAAYARRPRSAHDVDAGRDGASDTDDVVVATEPGLPDERALRPPLVVRGRRWPRLGRRRIRLHLDGRTLEMAGARAPRISLAAAVKDALGLDVTLGALGVDVPPLRQGREDEVEVSISREYDADSIIRALVARSQVPEATPIQTSAIMQVDLTGPSFQIRRLNPPGGEQVVSETATWEFVVVPLASGTQFLTVSATMQIAVPGHGEKTLRVPSLKRAFDVEVDRVYASRAFVRRNWQWIGTSCIAVTLAVLGVVFR